MPEPSEVERDVSALVKRANNVRLDGWERAQAVRALAARLKEVEGERDAALEAEQLIDERCDEAEIAWGRAEAQLRVAREGLEQIATPLDSVQPGWDIEDAEQDRAAMQRIARKALARLDTPDEAASGSGGEGAA